jgi:transposase
VLLSGILFVLQTAIAWECLPQEMGCGSGMTCWRRLHESQEAGVRVLLPRLHRAELIDWSRAAIDSSYECAVGGAKTGPSPVDPGRRGSKHHPITCAGQPDRRRAHRGNVNDVPQTPRLVDGIPPVRGRPARPRRRPKRPLGEPPAIAGSCARGASAPGLPSPRAHTAPGSVASAGSWSAPSPGGTPVPPAARPLGAPRRHRRSIPRDRLQPHLLQGPHPRNRIAFGTLSGGQSVAAAVPALQRAEEPIQLVA